MRNTSRGAAWVAAGVLLTACAPPTPKITLQQDELRGRLKKNDLRFVILPDASTTLVEVDVRYEVGAREDPPGKAGLAHLVEHLMFEQRPDGPGTPTLSAAIRLLTLASNAYTNWDSTHYMLNARADQLDALIKIEAMRMHYGCATISQEEFLREREVVRNEIRGHNRDAEGRIEALTLAGVYPAGHAYAREVGGDDEQLARLTLDDACELIQRYYAPARATVVVAGGVAPDAVVASLERWFGVVAPRVAAPRRVVEAVAPAPGRATVELDVERPWVTVAWPLPDASTPEGEAVAAGIYGAFFEAAGRSDRYECSTDGYPAILGGKAAPMFMVALELVSMDKLDECVGFVMKAARNARSRWTGGMWRQHEEWRNRRKAQVIGSLERMFGPGGRTDQVADLVQFSRDVAFDGGDRYLFHALTKLGQLEPGAVGAALDRALDPARAHVLVLAPSARGLKGDRRASASFQGRAHDEEDAAIIDPAEATRPLTPPSELARLSAARRFQLANGLRVALLPTQGLPVVSAELVFDAGEAAAPAHPLLAQQAAAMIALPPDATALAETGVRLDCRATPDHTVCRARGMSVYLDVVIKGLERLITTGDTPQLAVESWQRTAREQVGHRRTQRRLEFERQQRAAVFGADHPYARAGLSSPAAIDELGRDELAAFRAAHYTAANATLVLAGAFDPAAAEAQIRDAFGDWAPGHKDDPVAAPVVAARGARWIGVVERDDDPQVDVAVLYPSAPGMRGQQAARLIVTELLNQRMETIRSERGATYGTYARRSTLVAASAYVLGGAVDAPRAGEAIQAMREGVDSLRRGDDFARRFAQARRVVVQRLVAESTSSAGLAGRLGVLAQFGLPADHFDDVLRQVAAMTPAQVRDLIARELDPRAETVVALGDRAALTAAFAAAGLTGAQLVD